MPVYHQPLLLKRIIKNLEAANHYFFVSVDAKTKNYDEFVEALKDIENVIFISPRIDVKHGGYSQLLSNIQLVRKAHDYDKAEFDFYHFTSGQDYPLRTVEQFDNFFENTDHSFVYLNDEKVTEELRHLDDIFLNQYHFNNGRSFIARVYEKLKIGKLISYFFPRKPIEGVHGGWDWASWHKDLCDYIVEYLDKHPEYVERFNHTRSAVETCFNTIISRQAENFNVECQNPLRFVSWHPQRPVASSYRPYNLNELDYERVIDSKAFFCRKVDEKESAKLLDMIDAQRGNDYDINQHTNYV